LQGAHIFSELRRSVGGGLSRLHLDAADTGAVGDLEADVAILTVGGAPRVLYLVVLNAVLNAVADSENTVVEVGAAAIGGADDTALVALEDALVGLDGNGDGALGDLGLEGLRALGGHIDEGLNFNLAESLVGLAASELAQPALVGVVRFGFDGVGLGPLEGLVHDAAHAAQVSVVSAADELLLREGEELASGDEVSALHGTSGGERPA